MFRSSRLLLCSASMTALAFAAPAYAQEPGTDPVTPSEVQQCSELPTEAERAACIQGQATPEGTPAEAGELGILPPPEAAEQQAEGDAIVVTGSRLRTSPYNSPDPITVVSPELEEKAGAVNTAEILQSNPVAAGSFQITDLISAGSFVTNGGPGAETLSLRGLGPERTLVLVNSRRAGPAGTQGAIAGFDLNVMPSSLIQSVEILKTGASSIYGSDAIAGVVNIITKRATDGIELRAFGSVPLESGGENYNISGAYGREFERGHFIVGLDYTRFDRLKRGDRDYLNCPEELIFTEAGARADLVDPRTGRSRCVDSIHNMLLLTNVGLGLPTLGGRPFTVVQFNNSGDQFDEFLPVPDPQAVFTMPEGFFGFPSVCTAASTPEQIDLCRTGLGLQNTFGALESQQDVLPKRERITFWADGSFDINDNIELVGEFLFNNRKTDFFSNRQLFFFQYPGNSILPGTGIGLPFFFCDPERERCDPFDAGDPINDFSGLVLFRPVVLIPTGNETDVNYYRAVGGLRGELPSNFLAGNWRWDSYAQFSRSDGDYTFQRVFQDAVETQEFRTQTCAGTVTRVRGVPCLDIDWTDPRVLAGNFTPEEQAFLFGADTGNTLYDQLTLEASVAGDLLRLPAGPVGLALGVQWRRDEIDDQPGDIARASNPHFDPSIPAGDPLCDGFLQPCDPTVNNAWGQSTADRTAGHSTTKEAFGEVQIPLIHNTPFIQSFSLSGAARITDVYAERASDGLSHRSKGNWTYKLGFNWQTNDWLRFRGTIGTSYRAPALFEQFLGDQTGFLGQTAIDPCVDWGDKVASGTLPARVGERCEALGIAPDYGGAGSSALIITGGGIGVLEPETSLAKTFSVVITPPVGLWSGNRFSVAVDYFDIDVKGEIAQLGAGNIIFRCLNSDSYPDDPVCTLFTRAAPGSAEFPNILEVRDAFINVNRQRNRGIDLTGQMSQDLGRWGRFNALAQMTWQLEDFVELFEGTRSDFEGEAGEPTWVGDFKFTWDKGPWSAFWGTTVIGGTSDEQNLRDANGGEICPVSTIRGGPVCPIYRLKPQFYHNVSLTREFAGRFSVTLGVRNLFDNRPPPVSAVFGPISNIGNAPIFGTQYDLIGRRIFASVRAKF